MTPAHTPLFPATPEVHTPEEANTSSLQRIDLPRVAIFLAEAKEVLPMVQELMELAHHDGLLERAADARAEHQQDVVEE